MQFPHDVRSNVEVHAMPKVTGEAEEVIPVEIDPPRLKGLKVRMSYHQL